MGSAILRCGYGADMSSTEPTGPGCARVGCSGWSYRHWRGPVYDPQLPARRWFAEYAKRFSTVELNNTFYRLPSESAVSAWHDAAPSHFVYALKLGAFGTHRMKLRDAGSWLPNHVDRARLLGSALGPTLVQMPPRWRRDVERLDEFFSAAPRDMRWAVELREPSWLHDDVFSLLHRYNAALCVHDLLVDHPFLVTADWTYVRCHGPFGPSRKYQGRYGAERLGPMAEQLRGLLDSGLDVYCYFNNDDSGYAVNDATWLADRLAIDGPS